MSAYEAALSRDESCIWTCEEGVPITSVDKISYFRSYFSDEYGDIGSYGDYNICYKKCDKGYYFNGVSCRSVPAYQVVDTNYVFTY